MSWCLAVAAGGSTWAVSAVVWLMQQVVQVVTAVLQTLKTPLRGTAGPRSLENWLFQLDDGCFSLMLALSADEYTRPF